MSYAAQPCSQVWTEAEVDAVAAKFNEQGDPELLMAFTAVTPKEMVIAVLNGLWEVEQDKRAGVVPQGGGE